MLSIEKLNVSVGDKKILEDFNLKIGKGEVHAIMGPNGSGKSTLSYVLAGKDGYEVDGKILFRNENIIDLEADERAQKGIFLAFQYPIEIPGVFMNNFLKTSLNAVKKAKGQKEVDVCFLDSEVIYYPIFNIIMCIPCLPIAKVFRWL